MYALPYLIFLSLLFFLYLNETGKIKFISRKAAVITAFICALFFIGLRGHVMCDFIIYYEYFKSLPALDSIIKHNQYAYYGFEPGFVIYSSIIKTLFGNYFVWVAINAAIDLIVLFITFKRFCNSTILPFIFFFIFQGYTIEFNLMRNAKSIDLFLLSLPYLQNRKFLKYTCLNLLGTLFHSSAFLYIPFYFLLTRTISTWVIWFGIIISNLLFLLKLPFVNVLISNIHFIQIIGVYDMLVGYASSGVEFGISFGYIERTITMILFCMFRKKLAASNPFNTMLFNSYWFYYVSFLFFYEITVFVERIPLLFVFSYWMLYPNLIALHTKYRQLVIALVAMLAIARATIGFNNKTMTYSNVLFSTPDYEDAREMQLDEMRNGK